MEEKILVIDFGGQYNQLIARRIRELNVESEIVPYNRTTVDRIKENNYKGIIFTGGPNSVNDEQAPHFDTGILNAGIPVLGICYGHQLLAQMAGGKVESNTAGSEYGKANLCTYSSELFKDVPEKSICWMSHSDSVVVLPVGFKIIAETDKCQCAAMENSEKKMYSVQFHPEVTHTEYGKTVLKNFLYGICGCSGSWQMESFIDIMVEKYKTELKNKKVLLALSGGVDSAVVAALLNKAIGKNLICVFVDHGLMRKNEADMVEKIFKDTMDINFIRVNRKKRFLKKLSGVTDPEAKRKIIGEEFIRTFEKEAQKLGKVDYLAQGTIYPDVIESGFGASDTIKSHHNVGGLPEYIDFEGIVEPLKTLFKDEVRDVGRLIGLPQEMVYRQPFPGPGLAVRVIGEITDEKLSILREADYIFCRTVEKYLCEKMPSQYFAVLTDTKSVGVMGDGRSYGYVVALRAVDTDDFMTAEWAHLPFDLLEEASNRITGEVKGVSRVVYDISSKPPATVEWE